MKRVNKKLMIILLSGFVLMTGCKSNEISSNKVITSETSDISNNDIKEPIVETEEYNEIIEEQLVENVETPDSKITTYVNDLNDSIDTESIKTKVVEKFIVLTDFIFYDGEIGGIKFNDLKEETKESVLDTYSIIDNKIENKFPNYKDTIADKYNISKSFIKEKYTEISDKLKDKVKEKIGEDTYNDISGANQEIIEQDKENLEKIKEVVDEKTDTAKTKIKNWYQNLKEKY